MTRNFIILIPLVIVVSCHSRQPSQEVSRNMDTVAADATVFKQTLKSLHFDYTKDPACGMPLKAGLEDTAYYKGKLYGFCSKECKAEFLKNPPSYLSQIK